MPKSRKALLTLGLVFLAGCARDIPQQGSAWPVIQDTAKAARYFEDELNFNTTPYGAYTASKSKQQNITIVDVRAAKDYAAGHIPGAINIPFEKWNGFEGPEAEIPGLRKDGYNYVYCYELLCTLAQKAAKKFATLGYPVKEMKGGFESWKSHRYPIEK